MILMLQELGLLLVLVLVAILTYSSLVYFAERDVKVDLTYQNTMTMAKTETLYTLLKGMSR